jgi:hypothetical protein
MPRKGKKTGRPATGQIPAITARLPRAVVARVEEWAAKNGATRSAAIRRLVELALPGSDPTKQTSPRAAAKATGLAADQIDKLANPAMPVEERRARKRRLTSKRGPPALPGWQ